MIRKFNFLKSSFFIIALLLVSCEFFDHRYKYKAINNDELDITVNYVESKNGLLINNKYYYGGGYLIQNNHDKFPKWLFQKEEMRNDAVAIYDNEGQLLTSINHIKPPYRIFKKANSNILYLVKNNDTLKFTAF